MDTENYDRQVLTDYLLGSLPDAETERFDELSITDDRFADALKAAENDLVDAYARGELSGAELEKFNSYYLASSLRRGKVDFAGAFQEFAKKNAAGEMVSGAEESKNGFAGLLSVFNIFAAPNAVLRFGFAALILGLIVFGGWFLLKNSGFGNSPGEFQAERENLPKNEQNSQITSAVNLPLNEPPEKETAETLEKPPETLPEKEVVQKTPPVEQTPRKNERQTAPDQKINIATFILAPPVRGNNQLQTVAVAPKTDFVEMRLQLEADEFAAYRIVLVDRASGKKLWQSGKVKARAKGEDKYLKIQFPAELLKPKIYSLTVSGIADDGSIENFSDYSFRIVR